jgi:hypothetical protein
MMARELEALSMCQLTELLIRAVWPSPLTYRLMLATTLAATIISTLSNLSMIICLLAASRQNAGVIVLGICERVNLGTVQSFLSSRRLGESC